ncbi:MAG: hypothetical protein WKG01_20580 [Kofleriaceae bacterium]
MIARTVLLATFVAACGDPPARVALVPVLAGPCNRVLGATSIEVTAFADSGEVTRAVPPDQALDISDFPADTLQLGVEVVKGGGVVGAIGKTAPLAFAGLADGTTIPIMMAPPNGVCPVGELGEARQAPVVARAGAGALVAGGAGTFGPLATAEFYDPATASFVPVEVPPALQDATSGLAGIVLTTLPDGRVALTGGSRGLLAVFDPDTRAFGATFALAPQRAFHGAAVIDDTHLILAGGCATVTACASSPLRSTIVYDLEGDPVGGPNLPSDAIRIGAQLFATGSGYVLAGGTGTAGEGDRFTKDQLAASKLVGLGAQATLLDGGAVLTAFARDSDPPSGAAAIVTPGGAVVPVRMAPVLAGARLVTLEDGSAIAFGGDARILRYVPTGDDWSQAALDGDPALPAFTAPALVRLADGSVLVLGGEATPSTKAWVYRPSLVGPASGSVTVVPASDTSLGILTVPDPATVTRATEWILIAPDDTLSARALAGGPRMRRGSVKATVTVSAGGLALIAQQTSPESALVARLQPGELARLERPDGTTACTGTEVAFPALAFIAALEVGDGVRVTIDDVEVLACEHVAAETGAWGVAASGAGARVAVATVTVAR